MKWYFACNSASKEYIPLIQAAVESAIKNTTLEPHFIYDGNEDDLTRWLEGKGVKIIYHRSSLYPFLEKKYSGNELKIASGAYLRCDIPIIEKDNEYVLYTDCDVIFLKDIKQQETLLGTPLGTLLETPLVTPLASPFEPEYFCCTPEVDINNLKLFNTGVMFMNIKNLKKTHKSFIRFIKWNLWRLVTWDQTAYQLFYGGKNSKLDLIYNHKPHWGINKNAAIIHFHGAKPTMFFNEETVKNMDYFNGLLYKKNPESYAFYLELFKKYYPSANYDQNAIKKLNDGIYPITTAPKNPLTVRIKNFIRKHILAE